MLSLAACDRQQEPAVVVSTVPVSRPSIEVPKISEVITRQVNWVIITESNIDSKLQDLKDKNQPVVLFALTSKGYENLSLNFNDIRSLVEQQKQVILSYESYYSESENN